MRKSLFSAAAVAPLLFLAAHGSAWADPTTITDDLTAGISTSNYNSGIPSDLVLDNQGSITLKSGTAVTIDSDNTFQNNGSISIQADSGTDNSNNATGVLIEGGHTGSFNNTNTISVTEDYTAKDNNGDGVVDGPWAMGSGRYGVRVVGPGAFTGDILNTGGDITVEGNNSFGISVETQLIGNLKSTGKVNITGDNSAAIAETSGVTGDVQVTGAITANGEGVKGIDLSGDVGGSVSLYGATTVTGYRITSRPQNPDDIAGLDPSNLVQGGPGVDIRASVAHGIYLGAPPAGTTTDTAADVDLDKDGIPDVQEGSGSITVFGGAPALKIGDASKTIDIGAFGTDENAYGLILRGATSAYGLFDNVATTAIQIGAEGGGSTTIEGGIRDIGTITSSSHEADATGIHILAGGDVASLQMEGTIATTAVSAGTNQATAILIDAGATSHSFTNIGSVTTIGGGAGVSAYGVQDLSGTLSQVVNKGSVSTSVRAANVGDVVTGQTVAFDLSHNTTGVNFSQVANPDVEDSSPFIGGSILLGTGDDNVSFLAGNVLGALDFNAGGGSLTIDNGALYSGRLTASGTLSSVNVANGSLLDTSASTIRTGSLNVGASSLLVFSADPTNGTATRFDVSGAATIADGAKLGLNLLSLPAGTQTFTVVNAGSLSVGGADSTLLTQTPFLVVADAHTDAANGQLTIDVRRRTAVEAGFNRAETAAYDSVYSDLGVDGGIQRSFLAQQTQSGLLGLYDQMLPDHAGGVLRTLQWAAEAAGQAAAHAPETSGSTGPTRGWTQEIAFSENKERADASAYRILGFGIVAGLESVSPNGNAVGADISFVTGNVSNPDTPGDDNVGVQQVGMGVYYRGTFGQLHLDAQAGGGYMWADGRREFIYADTAGVVHKLTNSNWNGYSIYGRMGAYYDFNMGALYFRPQAHIDYFRLHESGYTESGGGNGFDLAVDGRTGDALSATASFIIGYTFGDEVKWRPEVELGYRGVVAGSGGDTTAAFVGGGAPFSLPAEALHGGGPIARFGIHAYGQYVDLKLDAGGEFRSGYTDLDLRLMVRIVF